MELTDGGLSDAAVLGQLGMPSLRPHAASATLWLVQLVHVQAV